MTRISLKLTLSAAQQVIQAIRQLNLSECGIPGASVAQVALAHGLNANLVHKWRRQTAGAKPSVTPAEMPTFIPVAMAPAAALVVNDIRIELRRGALAVNVT